MTLVWGDLLLDFGDRPPPRRGRSDRPWSEVHRVGDGVLWAQPPSERWVGHAVRSFADDRARGWLLGETYGRPPSDEELSAILRGGGAPADLPGSWLLIGVDSNPATGPRWSLVTDRLGTLHGYRLDGPRAAVATSFHVLVDASRRRLDPAALAGFCATGFFPGERTALTDVRQLRPSRRYVFSAAAGDGGRLVEVETTWRWRSAIGSPTAPGTYDQAIDAFDERLRRVMADLVADGRVAVPISGGLDSRSTVAVLEPKAVADPMRVWAFSYGYGRSSVEPRIAREIAAARRLGFVSFAIPPYLLDQRRTVHAAVEGFQDLTQTRQAAVAPWLGERADAVIAAHWGDVWLDAMGADPRASDSALLDLALSKILKRGRRWLLDHLVRPLLDPRDPSAADPDGVVRDQMAAELARVARVDDADLRLKAFKTEQWSFRWTLASLRAYRLGVVPRLPFYDPRLVDFFLALPAEWLADRRLQRDHLVRYAPDLARVPWQQTGLPLAPSRLDRATEWIGRGARKLGRLAIGRQVVERNWEVQFRGGDRPTRLRRMLLRPGAPHLELVEPTAITALLDRFEARPDPATGYTVSMLFTLAELLAAIDDPATLSGAAE